MCKYLQLTDLGVFVWLVYRAYIAGTSLLCQRKVCSGVQTSFLHLGIFLWIG